MPIPVLLYFISVLLLSNISLLGAQQELPPSKDPAAISHFLVAIPVLSRNRKSTSFPFFVQNSFFKEREDPSCLCISFLSTLYRLQSSSRCLGVCIELHSLKHLPSLSFPIILEKDLKQPFPSFNQKNTNYSFLGYLILGALREKEYLPLQILV